ncbi:MAG: TolC family protein [Acidobacteria bacterium]|nr:TolC family protein [Acidobacteriota bacterium]
MRAILLAGLLIAVGMQAQVYEDSPRLASLVRGGNAYLSLRDAIAIALENNLDVELQRLGPRFAETDLKRTRAGALPKGIPLSVREGPKSVSAGGDVLAAALGPGQETNLSIAGPTQLSTGRLPPALDPVLTGKVRTDHLTAPQLNSFLVGTPALVTGANTANFGWQKGFLAGGELSAGFENSHQTLNHRRYDLAPFNTSSFGIAFTQPLLRGFGRALNSRFIRIAGNSRIQSDLVFRQQVISTVAGVIRLYWDLASLNEDVKVRRQTLERAEKLLSDNQAHVEAGTRAPIEVVRARAEVARSRRDLIAAESLVRQQETVLKDYLTRRTVSDSALAAVRIIPTDTLRVDRDERIPPASELAANALKQRPDLAQARIQIDSTQLALRGSKNALLPSLDLVATVRNNALAGDVNPLTVPGMAPHRPDPILLGGYGAALSQLLRRSFPDYGVGVQLTIPLRNRAAEADYARDNLALRQQQLRLRQLNKQVHVEIENALIALEQARATLAAAESEREFQEQALAAEEEKLAVGASTTFLVIQYQRDLAQARSAEVSASAGFVKARAALDRASGLLLESHGVSLTGSETRVP